MTGEGPKWALVATFPSRMEGEMMAGLLRREGLHPRLQWETAAELFGLRAGSMSSTQLYVPEEERTRARELVRAYGAEQGD